MLLRNVSKSFFCKVQVTIQKAVFREVFLLACSKNPSFKAPNCIFMAICVHREALIVQVLTVTISDRTIMRIRWQWIAGSLFFCII